MVKIKNYFDIYITNPFRLYNKIKKYFRPLKFKIYFSRMFGNCAKILEITSFDLTWKDKWHSPRHEYNPRINISLFNYFHWRIELTLDGDMMNDMVYWESALSWMYYNKSLPQAIKSCTGWKQFNKETGQEETITFKLLNEPWQTQYDNQTLENIIYEDTL